MTNDTQPTAKRPQPRFAPGPLGRGVYLSDLVRWLMEKHEDVRTRIVKEKLCPVLLAERPQLYLVHESNEATPLPDGRVWFRSRSGNREVLKYGRTVVESYIVDGRRVVQKGSGRSTTQYTPDIGQGLDGAVQWLQAYWGYSGDADAVMNNKGVTLCISEADARRLWGWRGADEAAPAVDAVAKPDDRPQDATNDAWWRAWYADRIAKNTKPDGTISKTNDGDAKWTDEALMVLHLRHSHLMSAFGMSFAAAKTAIAKDLRRSHQSLNVPLKNAADLVTAANNKPEQQVS